jgi:hypothetical protein
MESFVAVEGVKTDSRVCFYGCTKDGLHQWHSGTWYCDVYAV